MLKGRFPYRPALLLVGVALMLSAPAVAQPTSGMIAFRGDDGSGGNAIIVFDLASGERRQIDDRAAQSGPVWAPDGQRLAYVAAANGEGAAGQEIVVHGLATGDSTVLADSRAAAIDAVAWGPDGARVASVVRAAGEGPRLRVHGLTAGTAAVWGGGAEGLCDPAWLPNLNMMLLLDPENELRVEGVDVARLKEEGAAGALLATRLAPGEGGLRTEPVVVTEHEVMPILPILQEGSGRFAEWHPRPDRKAMSIAYESNDGGDREIFVINRRGITDVTNHRAADWNPVWSPEEDAMAFESFRHGRRGVYRVFTDTAHVVALAVHDDLQFWAPAWSADGEWLAFCGAAPGMPPGLFCAPAGGGGRVVRIEAAGTGVAAPAWRPEAS